MASGGSEELKDPDNLPSLTLDTGALIALEQRERWMMDIWRTALKYETRMIVPAPALGEWWIASSRIRQNILEATVVACATGWLGQAVGLARSDLVKRVGGKRSKEISTVDLFVMATANVWGRVVYTGDPDDLMTIREVCFPNVRVYSK